MELVFAIGALILLALAAPRWGHDSRRLLEPDGWLGDVRPRRPRSNSPAGALAAARDGLDGVRVRAGRVRAGRRRVPAAALASTRPACTVYETLRL